MSKKDDALKLALEEIKRVKAICLREAGIGLCNEIVIAQLEEALAEQPAQSLPWHHPDCEGECIACLIEREVEAAYGTQGLVYLRRHVSGGGIKGDA